MHWRRQQKWMFSKKKLKPYSADFTPPSFNLFDMELEEGGLMKSTEQEAESEEDEVEYEGGDEQKTESEQEVNEGEELDTHEEMEDLTIVGDKTDSANENASTNLEEGTSNEQQLVGENAIVIATEIAKEYDQQVVLEGAMKQVDEGKKVEKKVKQVGEEKVEKEEPSKVQKLRKKREKRKMDSPNSSILGKRPKKAGIAVVSPFQKRMINLFSDLREEVKHMWEFAVQPLGLEKELVGREEELLFKRGDFTATRVNFSSMSEDLDICVMDSFTMYVDDMERWKSNEKPSRLIGKVYNTSEDVTQEVFDDGMDLALGIVEGRLLKKIDLILIPVILNNETYVVVSFNLKINGMIELLHNSTKKEEIGEFCKFKFFNLTKVIKYLKKWKLSAKAGRLEEYNGIDELNLKWDDPKSDVNGGIYAMRHLETYMGPPNKIDGGWGSQIQNSQISRAMAMLRKKYAYAIINSECTEMKKMVIEKLKNFVAHKVRK